MQTSAVVAPRLRSVNSRSSTNSSQRALEAVIDFFQESRGSQTMFNFRKARFYHLTVWQLRQVIELVCYGPFPLSIAASSASLLASLGPASPPEISELTKRNFNSRKKRFRLLLKLRERKKKIFILCQSRMIWK